MSPIIVTKVKGLEQHGHGWIGGGGQIIAWRSSRNGAFASFKVKQFAHASPVTSSPLSPIAMTLIKSEIETLWLLPK